MRNTRADIVNRRTLEKNVHIDTTLPAKEERNTRNGILRNENRDGPRTRSRSCRREFREDTTTQLEEDFLLIMVILGFGGRSSRCSGIIV